MNYPAVMPAINCKLGGIILCLEKKLLTRSVTDSATKISGFI
jgi:hypothetical protein